MINGVKKINENKNPNLSPENLGKLDVGSEVAVLITNPQYIQGYSHTAIVARLVRWVCLGVILQCTKYIGQIFVLDFFFFFFFVIVIESMLVKQLELHYLMQQHQKIQKK